MGRNFVSVCHRCKCFTTHDRGEESNGLHSFYKQHEACMRVQPGYLETLDDQLQERPWMRNDKLGYTDLERDVTHD